MWSHQPTPLPITRGDSHHASLDTVDDDYTPDYALTVKVQLRQRSQLFYGRGECAGSSTANLVAWVIHTNKQRKGEGEGVSAWVWVCLGADEQGERTDLCMHE